MAPDRKISNNTFSVYTEDDKIYGRFEYDEEDFIGNVYHIVVPKIELPFNTDSFDFERNYDLWNQSMTLNIENHSFRLFDVPIKNIDSEFNDSDIKMFAVRKLIKKAPPKKMTLSEIEQALGYSVNIVTEAEKEETKDK